MALRPIGFDGFENCIEGLFASGTLERDYRRHASYGEWLSLSEYAFQGSYRMPFDGLQELVVSLDWLVAALDGGTDDIEFMALVIGGASQVQVKPVAYGDWGAARWQLKQGSALLQEGQPMFIESGTYHRLEVYIKLDGSSSVFKARHNGETVIDWTGSLAGSSIDALSLRWRVGSDPLYDNIAAWTVDGDFEWPPVLVHSHFLPASTSEIAGFHILGDAENAHEACRLDKLYSCIGMSGLVTEHGVSSSVLFAPMTVAPFQAPDTAALIESVCVGGHIAAFMPGYCDRIFRSLVESGPSRVSGTPVNVPRRTLERQVLFDVYTTSPFTGQAWTWSEVNSMKFGFSVEDS